MLTWCNCSFRAIIVEQRFLTIYVHEILSPFPFNKNQSVKLFKACKILHFTMTLSLKACILQIKYVKYFYSALTCYIFIKTESVNLVMI